MSDLISRTAIINKAEHEAEAMAEPFKSQLPVLVTWLAEKIPSEEPEIIRCKDCKHWREGTVYSYCDILYGMGVLDAYDYTTEEDDYCSYAERRTDE